MQDNFKPINKTLKRIILLGNVLRFPVLAQVVFLLSCKLCFFFKKKKDRGRRRSEKETFIACSLLFADYFPKMLSRISIACD